MSQQRKGRMRVIMTVHGGEQGLMDCMEGLVVRNERSIRTGAVPVLGASRVAPSGYPVWRDAVTALADGIASAPTMVAWQAAEERAKGRPARVAMVSGFLRTVYVDYREEPVKVLGLGVPASRASGLTTRTGPEEGRVTEHMLLTLDDDLARPVNEINSAIARHNSKRMLLKGDDIPKLYESGVVYKSEGSPELWWDAEEILRVGNDDCEGLAAYRAGELINDGFESGVECRYITSPHGKGRLFHAVTRVVDPTTGRAVWDDPSVRLGMPVPTYYRTYAAKQRRRGLDL